MSSPYLLNSSSTVTSYDPSFMVATTVVDTSPADTVIGYAPNGQGESPLLTWNGVIYEVNKRLIVAGLIVDEDGNSLEDVDDIDANSVINVVSSVLGTVIVPVLRPKTNSTWTRQDVLIVRDYLRMLNAHTVFMTLSRVWSKNTITDLLSTQYIRSQYTLELQYADGATANPINKTVLTFAPVLDFPIVGIGEGNAITHLSVFMIDMGLGVGPQPFVSASLSQNTAQSFLTQWALEDAFTGTKPIPRGTIISQSKVSPGPAPDQYGDIFTLIQSGFTAGYGIVSDGTSDQSGGGSTGGGSSGGAGRS